MPVSAAFADSAVEIPLGIVDLQTFREWTRSPAFPDRGRIDLVAGAIEVDMAADNLFWHSSPKSQIAGALHARIVPSRLGHLWVDKTRVTCPEVELSVEPDIVFVSCRSISAGTVELIAGADRTEDNLIEVEGPPDLIIEVVSDGSFAKDTRRLMRAYYAAGVQEYWLVDARGARLRFEILRPGKEGYVKSPVDRSGFQRSIVLERKYRLTRERGPDGMWFYDLLEAK